MSKGATPGPWKREGIKVLSSFASRDTVAVCPLPKDGGTMEAVGNAAIIAAAPALRDALALLWEEINDPARRTDSGALVLSTPAMEQARAALALAEAK